MYLNTACVDGMINANLLVNKIHHYTDVSTRAMVSQITGFLIVCSTICSHADQRKHQSSPSLAFVRRVHWWLVDSPHKGPVTRKMFTFDDVSMFRIIVYSSNSALRYISEITHMLYIFKFTSSNPNSAPITQGISKQMSDIFISAPYANELRWLCLNNNKTRAVWVCNIRPRALYTKSAQVWWTRKKRNKSSLGISGLPSPIFYRYIRVKICEIPGKCAFKRPRLFYM